MTREADSHAPARRVLVAAIGNPDRGDDGVGALVVQRLAGRLPAAARMLVRRGDLLSLLDELADVDVLICVDAAAPVGDAGAIHRIDPAADTLPREPSLASSHAFGLADTLALARALGLAPREVVVYAIEGRCFDAGAPLALEVAAAAGEVAERIVAEIRDRPPTSAEVTSDA